MSLDRRGIRLAVTVVMWVVVTVVYFAAAAVAAALHAWIPPIPRTALDAAIPFLPWTILPYATLGLLTLAPVVAADALSFRRLLVASALALALAAACFIAFPHAIERPVAATAGSWAAAFATLQAIDPARNTCPSLHVAFAILVPLCLPRWWTWAWGGVVAASALTTGQHALIDVAGGIILALAGWWASDVVTRRSPPEGAGASHDRGPTPRV